MVDPAGTLTVRVVIDGEEIDVPIGTTVAAAVALASDLSGERERGAVFRQSAVICEPRSAVCGMGICHECRLTIDGTRQLRSCLTPCTKGMRIGTASPPRTSGRGESGPTTRNQSSPKGSNGARLPAGADPAAVDPGSTVPPAAIPDFADVLVVGAGPAGLAAAGRAGRGGRSVVLVDENPAAGGQIWRGLDDERVRPTHALHLPGTCVVDFRPLRGFGARSSTSARDGAAEARDEARSEARDEARREVRDGARSEARGGVRDEARSEIRDEARSEIRSEARGEARGGIRDEARSDGRGARGALVLLRDGVLHEVRYRDLVLATGARELFLPFPGWTLPNVFGAGGLQALVKGGWPIAGRRVVVAGTGPLLFAVASLLRANGAEVAAIVEQTPIRSLLAFGRALLSRPDKWRQTVELRTALAGVPWRTGHWVLRAEGRDRLERVVLTDGHTSWSEPCDALAVAYGLVPSSELARLMGCDIDVSGAVRVGSNQETSVEGVYAIGELTGIGGLDLSLAQGELVGCHLGANDPQRPPEPIGEIRRLLRDQDRAERFAQILMETFALRPEVKALAEDTTVVCRCEDVVYGDLRTHSGWRDAKLATRCGMGPCQGRVCGAALRELLGWEPDRPRPPLSPVPVRAWTDTTEPDPF